MANFSSWKSATEVVKSIALAGAIVLALLGGFVGWVEWQRAQRAAMRARDLPVTVRASAPIIAAIERHARERGTPPESLQVLVPRYLKSVPPPGPVADSGWMYAVDGGRTHENWRLWVEVRDEYSPNILMGFGDAFVFHPSGQYLRSDYRGILVRVGAWGYYVE